jgi:hypothetical protein
MNPTETNNEKKSPPSALGVQDTINKSPTQPSAQPCPAGQNPPEPQWEKSIERHGSPSLDSALKWLAVFGGFSGLIYGTGYLIEFAFLNSMNVHGAASDLLKAKYFYAGFLFLQFPASLISIVLAFYVVNRRIRELRGESMPEELAPHNGKLALKSVSLFRTSAWTFATLLVVFYILIAFAKRGVFSEHQETVAWFFAVMLLGTMGARELDSKILFKDEKTRLQFGAIARLTCLIVGWVLAVRLFYPATLLLVQTMFVEGGYLCYFFLALIGFLIYKIRRWVLEVTDVTVRTGLIAIAVATIGAIYCLAALTFAYRVYPFIPVSKGGGDYTDEHKVTLAFDTKYKDSLPAELLPPAPLLLTTNSSGLVTTNVVQALTSLPVVIIEETSSIVFIASPSGVTDASLWRTPYPTNKPTIIALKRDGIVYAREIK